MDGELTHDIIDNVLETLQAYCACREDCGGCRYSIAPHMNDPRTCAIRSIPAEWRVEQLGGDDNG